MARIALIGATGLIGSKLVPMLEGQQLLSLARRATLPSRAGWREKVGEMKVWPSMLESEQLDIAIAAIGTTWAKAKDWATFEDIDRNAVANFAKAAREAGARQLIVVSSVGADVGSRSEYLAIKGRMEADVSDLGYARVDLFRPGLLRGERGKERRMKERFGILLSPAINLALRGRLSKFQAIDAALVASAMRAAMDETAPGTFVHHNAEIRKLAR
ncbi:nucleoside-diphosphate sugar epimerase [Sphingomicrobium nitratireducens]|uniref:nucleoside-diphosphate sugar epimerase n=1 Tax=Sphingomicrobium nitratireducens TaxID=2964666 RepID=UPI00223F93A9|nr:nucleoside-diphosphate sugar epimerase [Sphingomicrobium nitratireducens]